MTSLVMIDTDILSLFFRKHLLVMKHVDEYLRQHEKLNISMITYYEVLSGLKHQDAKRQLPAFLNFATWHTILPLTQSACEIGSEIYAQQRKMGQTVDDIDILIASIALDNNLTLVTANQKHFNKINGLSTINWAEI